MIFLNPMRIWKIFWSEITQLFKLENCELKRKQWHLAKIRKLAATKCNFPRKGGWDAYMVQVFPDEKISFSCWRQFMSFFLFFRADRQFHTYYTYVIYRWSGIITISVERYSKKCLPEFNLNEINWRGGGYIFILIEQNVAFFDPSWRNNEWNTNISLLPLPNSRRGMTCEKRSGFYTQ